MAAGLKKPAFAIIVKLQTSVTIMKYNLRGGALVSIQAENNS
jgi:hypothetical protein